MQFCWKLLCSNLTCAPKIRKQWLKNNSLDLNGMAAIEAEQTQKICIEKQFRSAHRLTDSTYRVNKCLTMKTTQWCEAHNAQMNQKRTTATTFAFNSENLCPFPCQVNWHGTYSVQTLLRLHTESHLPHALPTPSSSIRIIDLLSMVHLFRKFLESKYTKSSLAFKKKQTHHFFLQQFQLFATTLFWWIEKKRWTQQNPVSLNKQKITTKFSFRFFI